MEYAAPELEVVVAYQRCLVLALAYATRVPVRALQPHHGWAKEFVGVEYESLAGLDVVLASFAGA